MHTKAKTMKIYTGETMEDLQLLGLDLHVNGLVVVGNICDPRPTCRSRSRKGRMRFSCLHARLEHLNCEVLAS